MRPGEWTKNLFVFAGLLFGQRLTDTAAVVRSIGAFAIFCALASVVYLVNDVMDREQDREHPRKRLRPIASGALQAVNRALIGGVLAIGALGAAWWMGVAVRRGRDRLRAVARSVFWAAQAHRDHRRPHDCDWLRAARVSPGAVAVAVPMSPWLLICTIQLALFLGLSKRRHELTLLADGAIGHRRILQEYSPYLLDQMIGVVTASTLMAYILYATSHETAEKFGTSLLGLTIPFPLYGIFRYLYLVHHREGGGSPAELLLNDRPLLACVALWAVAVAVIIYRPLGI